MIYGWYSLRLRWVGAGFPSVPWKDSFFCTGKLAPASASYEFCGDMWHNPASEKEDATTLKPICIIQARGSTAPPLPPNGVGPQGQAAGSRFSCYLKHFRAPASNLHTICTLFAALQSPNPPICALYTPLRSPNFSTHNLYGLFTSLETIYIYKYIWCRFADMCVISAWFSCIQLLLRVVTRCCEQLENKSFTSIQIFSDVPHTGEGMTKTTPTSTWGRWGETTPTAGTTTGKGGERDHGWVGEGEPRNLDHSYVYIYIYTLWVRTHKILQNDCQGVHRSI